jgi:D-tagatose-1,6-bisphosphate aldolase subunit GatZ/KbaZ
MDTHNTDSSQMLQETLRRNRSSRSGGVYAICSAHPSVIDAGIRQAEEDGVVLHVESTSSQVNQDGGYTGQTPSQFADFIHSGASRAGISANQVLVGGDHLGPFPWRNQKAAFAMGKACHLVRACVLAGYRKIHLDASMACADDGEGPLADSVIAERAAILADSAEGAFAQLPHGSSPPLYVIGTEVPPPGGELKHGAPPPVTTVDHVDQTLEIFRAAFTGRGLVEAWVRVIGLVVQPGVEFGDAIVFDYDREKARSLSSCLPEHPPLVYEAHSTDYQSPQALAQMVEDHFAILKVGPWLTFAFREAVFALSAIEQEIYGRRKGTKLSQVRQALEKAMLQKPSYWTSYYHGTESELHTARAYSYSDRCRYYWHENIVEEEVERLFCNLSDKDLSLLLSQFLPLQYRAVRTGQLKPRPKDVVRDHIQTVLRMYAQACGMKS